MASFNPSPRPAKKRKLTATADESTPAIVLRALRTVKQAVYGKAASPKLEVSSLEEDLQSPAKIEKENSKWRKSGAPEINVENRVNGDPGTPSPLDKPSDMVKEARSEPSTQRPGRQKSRHGSSKNVSEEDIPNNETLQTPTRKRRKKVKGWVYAEDDDELCVYSSPADTTGLENGVGRLKKGREDLTIDMNPSQLKPRSAQQVASIVRIDGTDNGRRTSRRIEINEDRTLSEEVVPDSVPRRKRGRPRKDFIATSVSVDDEDEVDHNVDKPASRDASPDELAHESQEESEQEPSMQTPTKKPRKVPQQTRRLAIDETCAEGDVPLLSTIKAMSLPDQQLSTNHHAKALGAMLEKGPETLVTLKTYLLSGLTAKRRLSLIDLEDEHQKVKQIVEQTVLAGEGNSMLIIGSRGSGKTALVETVIHEISSDHRDDFHVVRLNGFIHTDDKLALREIWRQLGREMQVENEDLGGRNNYADTLSSLLALLAHPAEEADEDQASTARSVVFILDEFDLFAAHPRQTLLYNLFDVAQSRNAPIVVLGLTTRVNVVDSLEKRVKSRFGQRYVHLSLPRSFTVFQEICISALKYRLSTLELLHDRANNLQRLATMWNDYVKELFEMSEFQHFLQTLYTSSKSVPAFLNASLLPIITLTATNLPTPSSFSSHPLLPPDSKLPLISSLSTLALSLLISAARLDIILDSDVCTFGMVYDEYVALASKSKMQSSAAGQMAVGGGARVWSKELAKGAWEHLGKLELILPAVGGSRGAGKGQMWRVDVGLEEIGGVLDNEGGKGGALGKWCREI